MKQVKATILENEAIGARYYRMRLAAPFLARTIAPGQFIEVRCHEGHDPLLRRPFSVHRIVPGGIDILYEVLGKGTEIISRKKKGDSMDAIGPLGHGFTLPRDPRSTSHAPIIVAGGMGVAPLLALAEELAGRSGGVTALIGARTKNDLLCEKAFKKLGIKVRIATDDGSKGKKGFITTLLKDLLLTSHLSPHTSRFAPHTSHLSPRTSIYACGPHAMLKEVARIAAVHTTPCQVSLEERMACGVGVCLGCPVKVKSKRGGYAMVCKDGPVFDAREIIW